MFNYINICLNKAINAICLCVKCTNRSYDVGDITREDNGKLRMEFCRKSILKG